MEIVSDQDLDTILLLVDSSFLELTISTEVMRVDEMWVFQIVDYKIDLENQSIPCEIVSLLDGSIFSDDNWQTVSILLEFSEVKTEGEQCWLKISVGCEIIFQIKGG